jgi:hypothetical protein
MSRSAKYLSKLTRRLAVAILAFAQAVPKGAQDIISAMEAAWKQGGANYSIVFKDVEPAPGPDLRNRWRFLLKDPAQPDEEFLLSCEEGATPPQARSEFYGQSQAYEYLGQLIARRMAKEFEKAFGGQ